MATAPMAANDPVARAIDEAFEDHMKGLFQTFVRHIGHNDIDGARRNYRKDLAVALQARSEMRAIAEEADAV